MLAKGHVTPSIDPYSGVAQSLVQMGIPAVIAMQFEVTDDVAIEFAERFTELWQLETQ